MMDQELLKYCTDLAKDACARQHEHRLYAQNRRWHINHPAVYQQILDKITYKEEMYNRLKEELNAH